MVWATFGSLYWISSPIARGTMSRAKAWRITVNGMMVVSPSEGKVEPSVYSQNGMVPVTKFISMLQYYYVTVMCDIKTSIKNE